MGNILSLATFMPSIGAVILAIFLRGDDEFAQRNAKWVALATTLSTLLISLFILFGFDPTDTGFQMVEEHEWLLGFKYKLGVDGISLLLVMLTAFLMPIAVGACWNVTLRVKEYMIALMFFETLLLGAFLALDLLLLVLFMEATILPMMVFIGVWGGDQRVEAAIKFFLCWFFGSAVMLAAAGAIYVLAGTSDLPTLMDHQFATSAVEVLGLQVTGGAQTLLWLAVFVAFAVKLPLLPFHTWMPDAQQQAPTAGSMLLAALLVKLGGYGFLRISLPMFPLGSEVMGPFALWLGGIGILYAAIAALAQQDVKKLLAYSAVAQMGFVTVGIFSVNQQGIDGAIFQMLSHGFVSAAVFLCIGVLYDRLETTEIDAYGGLVKRMPTFALAFMLFTVASIGLPGTSGFVGVFLTLVGVFQTNTWVAVIAAAGLIFIAAHMLGLYRKVMMGDLIKESLKSIQDLSRREQVLLVPLAAMILLLGVYPSVVTDLIGPSVEALIEKYDLAISAHDVGDQTVKD